MNLTVSSSPHIRGKDTTQRIMLDVAIALAPALIAGIVFQGLRAGAVAVVCIASALLGEWSIGLVLRKHDTLLDGSALVTGAAFLATFSSVAACISFCSSDIIIKFFPSNKLDIILNTGAKVQKRWLRKRLIYVKLQ